MTAAVDWALIANYLSIYLYTVYICERVVAGPQLLVFPLIALIVSVSSRDGLLVSPLIALIVSGMSRDGLLVSPLIGGSVCERVVAGWAACLPLNWWVCL